MAIEGPLRELSIHDVFQLLDLSRKTGRLRVSSALRDNEGTVFFRHGRIIGATIKSNPHPLGAVLLRLRRISEADLARARAAQELSGDTRRLGEILVEQGAISSRELERTMRHQVEAVVFELLSWQEGFFSFAEEEVNERRFEGISLPTESLLMEGARRLDEWTQIQQHVPSLSAVPCLAEPPDDAPASHLDLLPNEWEVLAMVDGTRDLRAIAASLGRSEFEVGKIAFGLVTTAVIALRVGGQTPTDPAIAQLATVLADAREALAAERLDDALSHAAAAVGLAPRDAEARTALARVLFKQGRDAEGEEELRAALAIEHHHAPALMECARLAARRGELGQAARMWEHVAHLHPNSPLGEQARQAMAHASRLSAMLEAVDA